jgi:pimeloyl-ACP methyl ester carboxylesterase
MALNLPGRRFLYINAAALILWGVAMQSGCLAMRTPDAAWPAKLQEKGQPVAPDFLDCRAPDGRLIHAVMVSASDSLPVVLLVHGSPGSSDAFMDYLADTVLTRHARIVAIDRPGFGYSSGFGQPEPSLHAQAAAAKAVLDSLAPGRQAILVGHSMGAPVIACLAIHYPEQVGGLVLIGASVDPALEPDAWWQPVVHHPPLKWLIPRSFWTSNAEIMPLRGELERILPNWEAIRCPVTMVHARNDRLVPFENVAFARRMLTNCPQYRELVFDKGDHFVVWSRREEIRAAVLQML